MFDELDKKLSDTAEPATSPLPKAETAAPKVRAEDIFADVDRSGKPEILKPKQAIPGAPYNTVIPEEETWKNNKLMIFGLLFGGFLVIVGGGYLGLKLLADRGGSSAIEENISQEQSNFIGQESAPAVIQQADIQASPVVAPVVTQPSDSDRDGLSDEEETALGTYLNSSDTDADGLTDREEVRVYATNPLVSDSDADGYVDGEEVKNGFNPKGAGKLKEAGENAVE